MGRYQKNGINAIIDDEMIPVIDELNKLGLKTISCCSGHGKGEAQLCFSIKKCSVLIQDELISINWKRK